MHMYMHTIVTVSYCLCTSLKCGSPSAWFKFQVVNNLDFPNIMSWEDSSLPMKLANDAERGMKQKNCYVMEYVITTNMMSVCVLLTVFE